ncbi:MAG TPA: hypothetical protein VI168_14855, partial [Croceibacterium sp.]
PGSLSGDATKMIRGNLRVYDKALAALGARTEAGIVHRMIGENHVLLAVEEALHQVASGDVRQGLPALRAAKRGRGGAAWLAAFLLWRIAPGLAPPMMRWRQQRNSRGSGDTVVPALGGARPAIA